ncbi:DUF2069 domain-containing protein [Vibrio gallicus]|uniref:DUF2069 domain-containing protein n=1 Tax=Vibrio gallicus TaxID=190897 RepID=UPI0021C384F0|nr:DUF2069 domain-containing protein [Vibrio gallicus]
MNSPQANITRLALKVAQIGHFTLLVWVIAWHSLISPAIELNPWVLTLVWTVPLLLPIKGILKAKPYTFAWGNFVLLLYFLHSLTLIYVDEGERWLAIIELVIVSITFIANLIFSRLRGKELGLKLKKLSQLTQEESEQYSAK